MPESSAVPRRAVRSSRNHVSFCRNGHRIREDTLWPVYRLDDVFFSTLGIPLLAGREFTIADTAASRKTAIVNESLARHYFGSARNALGHSVGRRDSQEIVIVGMVKDSHHTSSRGPIMRTLFRPATQSGTDAGAPSGFAFMCAR
jgi:hypothetical protein